MKRISFGGHGIAKPTPDQPSASGSLTTRAAVSDGDPGPSTVDSRPCQACGFLGYKITQRGELAFASLCDCQARCPQCKGRRYVIRREGGYEVASPCSCGNLVSRIALYNDAQIPAAFAYKTLTPSSIHDEDGFWDSGFERVKGGIPSLRMAKEAVARHAITIEPHELKPDEAQGLLLYGTPGLGKTHLACALVSYLTLKMGWSCRFVDYHQLTTRIRATFGSEGSDETESGIIEPLVGVQVLVIDDIGRAQANVWALSVLDQIVTRRHNGRKTILGTTNFFPELEFERPADAGPRSRGPQNESLEDRIGASLASRLRSACRFVRLSGADYRLRQNQRQGPRRG